MQLTAFLSLLLALVCVSLFSDLANAYHKHKSGYVNIKVWRGPSHGHHKHKYAPFGYHFSVDEKH